MTAPIYLRGAQGLWSIDGAKFSGETIAQIDQSNTCKKLVFSEDGSLLAWCNAESTYIMDTNSMQILHDLGIAKVIDMKFSPKGNILATWNNYTVDKATGQGVPNLKLIDARTGSIKKTLIQKKQVNWAPEWNWDEKICCRNVNNELQFYENNNFDAIANKLHLQKVSSFELAKKASPTTVATYVPGSKGQPSFVRLYQYPNFAGLDSVLANKSFFKADRVNFYWNRPGQHLLLLTSTETSASSYYGDQSLHFLTIKGDSCLVPLQKTGPVYHVEWSPNNTEFIVVHGYMPAKVTLYSLKCEPVFDFGTGPRNECCFNPQGNILCLAGFGNLQGNLEFWDMRQKKRIEQTQALDTTHFEWSPDGQYLLTSTTAPRLRVGNGYRIWHYSGTLMYETFTTNHAELWQANWQPAARGAANFAPSHSKVETQVTEQPKKKAAAYRPPQARGGNTEETKPLQAYEPASNEKKDGEKVALSKNAKKKAAKKAKAAQEGTVPSAPSQSPPNPTASAVITGDPDKDKKIRNLRKKVQAIEKLKEQQASGKTLEKNQLEKIKTLKSIEDELEELEIS